MTMRCFTGRPSPASACGGRLTRRLAVRGAGGYALAALTSWLWGCALPSRGPVEVWIVGDSHQLTAHSTPLAENETYSAATQTVRLHAAVNDVVAFQIALRTRQPPAGPLDVRIEPLRRPDGEVLPGGARLFRMDAVRVQHFESWYAAFVRVPIEPVDLLDVLVPWDAPRGGGPVRLSDSATAGVWVDIPVPPGTAPGRYAGRLVVQDVARRRVVHVSRIELRVVPVAIEAAPSLPVVVRVDPSDLLREQLNWPRQASLVRIIPDDPAHASAVRLVQATMRLLHAHRLVPVLWASFPPFAPRTPDRGGGLDVDFAAYDALVRGYIDGSAYDDRVPAARWVLPVCADHPDVRRNGGLGSPRYARLLRDYLRQCAEHFSRRGWLERAFIRFDAPDGYTNGTVARLERLSQMVRRAELSIPIAAHLPMQSLAGFGWLDAPQVRLPGVGLWLVPAEWFEPAAARQRRALGARIGLVPGEPPYSPSLAVEAAATDAAELGWLAYRYDIDELWIEHAADRAGLRKRRAGEAPLVWPGRRYGLREAPVPSARLKRLRRGVLDHALLALLRTHGHALLAQRTARRIVRRALTEACDDNLLTWDRCGFANEPYELALARRAVLDELAGILSPGSSRTGSTDVAQAAWARVLAAAVPLSVRVIGTRLRWTAGGLEARVLCEVDNAGARAVAGTLTLAAVPAGWQVLDTPQVRVAPGARVRARVRVLLRGLAYNADGCVPFRVRFNSADGARYDAEARLAVAACPQTETPPVLDGDLRDWPVLPNNTAGAFALVRGRRAADGSLRPTLATRAAFVRDESWLYIAVHCELPPGALPRWQADNLIPTDRGIPWQQDVVEVLLDPQNLPEGGAGELYVLAVKPSGLLEARHGPRTLPPMCPSRPWPVDARVAVRVRRGRSWTIEIAIPRSAFPAPLRSARLWGLNVTRLDAARGEYSSWSAARGTAYTPSRLGNLLLP